MAADTANRINPIISPKQSTILPKSIIRHGLKVAEAQRPLRDGAGVNASPVTVRLSQKVSMDKVRKAPWCVCATSALRQEIGGSVTT